MEELIIKQQFDFESFNYPCCFCKMNYGSVIFCCKNYCPNCFHVSCACYQGLIFAYNSDHQEKQIEQQYIYCLEHINLHQKCKKFMNQFILRLETFLTRIKK
eukprot:TRINITY_DN3836_c0_g1_i2.p4 TRINITY_DN3836_c0_g1~~TRINITY_DN3836_c0_g1_i2.p4  ORF type:complete len:102 (-),score=7.72 TRINITY_DN3836_c0_g1_i2:178-483(-)